MLLTFYTCETRKCANVSISHDGVDEPDEFFKFNLTRTSNPRIKLDPASGRVQINGGDGELIITILPEILYKLSGKLQ